MVFEKQPSFHLQPIVILSLILSVIGFFIIMKMFLWSPILVILAILFIVALIIIGRFFPGLFNWREF